MCIRTIHILIPHLLFKMASVGLIGVGHKQSPIAQLAHLCRDFAAVQRDKEVNRSKPVDQHTVFYVVVYHLHLPSLSQFGFWKNLTSKQVKLELKVKWHIPLQSRLEF